MAAPHVTGAAALVKEAFPWMNGKQLADTLLSTAVHPRDMDGLPPFLIQTGQHPLTGNPLFNVIVPQASISSADLAGHEEEIRRLWESSGRSRYETLAAFTQRLVEAMDSTSSNNDPNTQYNPSSFAMIPKHGITPAQYMALFGMGVVNAARAVRGPGWLDANRLSGGDRADYAGNAYAMYGVDTQGFDGLWSHAIGQVQVQAGGAYPNGVAVPAPNAFNVALAGLDVGLFKSGKGALSLTGDNSYRGPTVVAGGEIALGVAGQADKTATLAGAVYVEPAGTFSGNGLVRGSLDFTGRLSPGLSSAPGSALTVVGDVGGGGELFSRIWADGRVNRLVGQSAVDLDNTRVRLSDCEGGAVLPSLRYQLVESEQDRLSGTAANDRAASRQGVTLLHEFRIFSDARGLYAEISRTVAAPEAKALSEGFASGATLVNLGADLVAGQGMNEAVKAARAVREGVSPGIGLATFGALSGGRQRYHSGSHADMRSLSLLAGLSLGADLAPGHLTLGAFFEYGAGAYDTYNSFSNAASVHGDGDIEHLGGGVLGRMDFADSVLGRLYAEASGRAGRVHNEYGNADLRDMQGRGAAYDASSAYYGFHLGTGYVWNITDAASLDLYGKYFWTRAEGDSVRLSTGDPVTFKDADSSRLRVGGRFAYAVNEHIAPYVGAGYEREFDGRARAATNGCSIDAPSVRGGTGIGELGLAVTPTRRLPLSFDLGVQGYVGKREGVTGTVRARLEF